MALSRVNKLDSLFYAGSVAVIGASTNPRKASHQIIKNMVQEGYHGTLFPIHPSLKQVFGLKCYPSLRKVKQRIDLLIVSIPAENTRTIFQEASERKDIKGAVILSAGFAETGDPEKIELEKEITVMAKKAGIRIIGPNCIGLINTDNKLCTGFAPGIKLKKGRMSILTQSGAFGGSFLMLAGDQPEPLGFSKFAHVGNASDVSMIEILDYFGKDPKTTVIAMYLEGIRQGRELFTLARQITGNKPVFCLKVGKTNAGSQAAFSHTASLAGSDYIYDAAFKQGGVIRVEDIEELLDTSKAASMLPLPRGNRVCVLTEAGGPGIIALDELGKKSFLTLASLSETTKGRIKKILPPMAVVAKPEGYIDMTAAAMEQEHEEALRLVLSDKGVDSVILISVPPTFLPAERVAVSVARVIQEFHKPVAVCLMTGQAMQKARQYLEKSNIPTFDTSDRAARALENLSRSAEVINLNNPGKMKCSDKKRQMTAKMTIKSKEKHLPEEIFRFVVESEAVKLLDTYRIPYPAHGLARDWKEAMKIAERIGYPVVLKIVSAEVIHKSDIGGVMVGIENAQQVRQGFSQIVNKLQKNRADARLEGVLICKQSPPGLEVIIGAVDDPTFGPTIMFGLGGIFAETLKDVSFRIAPLERRDAEEMIHEIKGYPLLAGARGQKATDIKALVELLTSVSRMVMERPEIKQLDLNPVRLYEKGLIVLDVRLLLKPSSRGMHKAK